MLHLPPRRALLSSVPAWVLAGFAGGLDLDFANGRAYGASLAQMACSRASAAYGDDASGNWSLFSANVPVITDKGLQVYEASTNQIRNNSMQGAATGSPGTLPTNWPAFTLAGLTQTIVALGAQNGIDYIDVRFSGTTNNTQILTPFEGTQQIAAVSGQTWTNSAFLALVGGSFSNVTGGYVYFSLRDSGGVQLGATGTAFTLGSLTATMQRFTATATLVNASLAYVQPLLRFTVTNGAAVDFTLRIGWPQIEQNATMTSPIRTTNAAATRNADVITLPVSGFDGGAVTLFGAGTPTAPVGYSGGAQTLLALDDGSTSNRVSIVRGGSGPAGVTVSAGPSPSQGASWAQNAAGKVAFADQSGDGAIVFNGATPSTSSTSGFPSGLNALHLGCSAAGANQFDGYITRLAAARVRLTNDVLQRITT